MSTPTPQTITVYGSAQVSVEPDIAMLTFSIHETDDNPRNATQKVNLRAQRIHSKLANFNAIEIKASHIDLSPATSHSGMSSKISRQSKSKKTYTAIIKFHIVIHDLEALQEIVTSLIDMEVNRLSSAQFASSNTQAITLKARKHALDNAHTKAKTYADAVNLQLGQPISIEEVEQNPTDLALLTFIDHDTEQIPLPITNPNNVNISAHLKVIFAIQT